MKIKTLNISLLTIIIMVAMSNPGGSSQAATGKDKPAPIQVNEYEVKAAFLYNFIKFADWPESKVAEPNTITIGLLGEYEFKDAFDAVKGKPINNKRLIIKNLGKFSRSIPQNETEKLQYANDIEQLRMCHVLFICDSEKENFKEILDAVKNYNVLTVGETEDFLDAGGIISFIPGTNKVVFDISQTAAKKAEIKISSRVLRLARKVIGAESSEQSEIETVYVCLGSGGNL